MNRIFIILVQAKNILVESRSFHKLASHVLTNIQIRGNKLQFYTRRTETLATHIPDSKAPHVEFLRLRPTIFALEIIIFARLHIIALRNVAISLEPCTLQLTAIRRRFSNIIVC